MFTENDTLIIKNLSNMWKHDPKNEFIYLVKPPGIFSYSIYCRLYQIIPIFIHFRIGSVTLYLHNAHVIAQSQL